MDVFEIVPDSLKRGSTVLAMITGIAANSTMYIMINSDAVAKNQLCSTQGFSMITSYCILFICRYLLLNACKFLAWVYLVVFSLEYIIAKVKIIAKYCM